jgi:hypothetical protein
MTSSSLKSWSRRETGGMPGMAFEPPVSPPMLFWAVRTKISPKASVTIAR